MIENNFDVAHAQHVHGAYPNLPTYELNDEASSITYNFRLNAISLPGRLGKLLERVGFRNYFRYNAQGTGGIFGPSIWWARILKGRGSISTQTFTMLEPIGPTETRLYFAVYHDSNKHKPVRWLFGRFMHFFAYYVGPRGDLYIWDNKILQQKPVLCALDQAPIMAYRRWWDKLGSGMKTHTNNHFAQRTPKPVEHGIAVSSELLPHV